MSDYLGRIITKNPQPPSPNSASGVWTLDEALQYSKAGKWPPGFQISRSVRLRASASAYLNRTLTTPTNNLKWTLSAWIKRGQIGVAYAPIFAGGTSGSAYASLWFNNDTLVLFSYNGSTVYNLTTNAVYRDPSAWYHIQIAFDSTQSTSSDRIFMYVNGVQVTSLSSATYPSLNYAGYINSAIAHYFGQFTPALGGYYYDGYLTEINFIDGQQLTPNSFGYADTATGVWQPLPYTGTYGNNGFYLTFADNSNNTATTLGKDYSGNGNNWTPNNISVTAGTTYDSMVDVPINWGTDTGVGGEVRGNYCTLNPISSSVSAIKDGNLQATVNSYQTFARGTIGVSSGKWYWECQDLGSNPQSLMFAGIIDGATATNVSPDTSAYGYCYYGGNGKIYNNGTSTTYGATYTTQVIGVALDLDSATKTITFYKANVSQGAYTITGGVTYFPLFNKQGYYGDYCAFNFGQYPFTYTAPSGYKALCTQNLPVPTILNGANYMAATLYTGSGSTQSISNAVNNISFQPDFVWVKDRTSAQDHKLTDSVRGTTKGLISDTTGAETTDANGVTAFNSNGFSLGTGTRSYSDSNADSYVGWQWLAGKGTTSSNTSGTVTSTVSVNATAGFSVVTFTAPTSGNFSAGHGLGVTPGLVITKVRNRVTTWITWHSQLNSGSPGTSYYMELNNATAQQTYPAVWGSTGVTSSVIGMGVNASVAASDTVVAYCFASISGYSAFGSYTGNGSTDGPFVYTGFRPRWVMNKRTDAADTQGWIILDTSRNSFNASTLYFSAANSNAEASAGANYIDILSNGFKFRFAGADGNVSGGTYIYAAFAENPFTIARAR